MSKEIGNNCRQMRKKNQQTTAFTEASTAVLRGRHVKEVEGGVDPDRHLGSWSSKTNQIQSKQKKENGRP